MICWFSVISIIPNLEKFRKNAEVLFFRKNTTLYTEMTELEEITFFSLLLTRLMVTQHMSIKITNRRRGRSMY